MSSARRSAPESLSDMSWSATVLDYLDSWISENPDRFQKAQPFPHAVLDGVFDDDLLAVVLDEFPVLSDPVWAESDDPGVQIKFRTNWQSDLDIPPITRQLVHFLNSGAFMRRLSTISGIPALISDPYYTGGGLNAIRPGGLLDVHCDGNWHHTMAVHRRLNAILYLNYGWNDDWGGHLEFWDRDLTGPVVSISPRANRLVVFETTDFSYHGHPQPLACPPSELRQSLILYYYTSSARPSEQVMMEEPHRALWASRALKPLDG